MDRPHSKSLSKQKRDLGPSQIHKYTQERVKVTTRTKNANIPKYQRKTFLKSKIINWRKSGNNKNGDYRRVFQTYQLFQ